MKLRVISTRRGGINPSATSSRPWSAKALRGCAQRCASRVLLHPLTWTVPRDSSAGDRWRITPRAPERRGGNRSRPPSKRAGRANRGAGGVPLPAAAAAGRRLIHPACAVRPAPAGAIVTVREKRRPAVGQLHQQRRGREARPVARLQPLQLRSSSSRGPERVGVAERPAAEGREAEAEDRADVAVARAAQDALAQAADRLVHHLQHHPLLDLRRRDRLARAAAGQERVDGLVRPLRPARRRCRSPSRSSAPAGRPPPRSCSAAGGAIRSPKAASSILADLLADVDPDLVEQGHRPDREAEGRQGPVDVLDARRPPPAGAPPRSCRGRGCGWCRSRGRPAPRSPSSPASCRRPPRWRSPPARSRSVTITSSSGIFWTGEK